MKVIKCPDSSFTYSNMLAVSSSDFDPQTRFVKVNDRFIFNVAPIPSLDSGHIGPTRIQREWGRLSINEEVIVEALSDSVVDAESNVYLGRMDVELSFLTPSQERVLSLDSEEVSDILKGGFENQIFSLGQPFVFDFRGNNIKGVVTGMTGMPLDLLQDLKLGGNATGGATTVPKGKDSTLFGMLTTVTTISVSKGTNSLIDLKGSSVSLKANAIIQPDFRFEDLGIGGLDKEFSNIFR
ncbi:transport between ER and Golgi ATPase protein, partial [Coemansia sp. RSA 2559]